MGAILSARWLGTLAFLAVILSDVTSTLSCLESEQRALLMFKRDLIDESNRLASWVDVGGGSCCDWAGVACDNSTGHVTGLHLQNDLLTNVVADNYRAAIEGEVEACRRLQLRGRVNSFLLELKHLMYLNLSGNNFGGTQIPSFLGMMGRLKYLDLSYAGFGGEIPPQIGNLTNLLYLHLGGIIRAISSNDPYPFDTGMLHSGFRGRILSQIGNLTKLRYFGLAGFYFSSYSIESLQWLSGFSSLRRLDISQVDLSKAVDWLDSINTLPSLRELRLFECGLSQIPPLPLLNNLSSLVVLDLSRNAIGFNSSTPKWIFQLRNLNTLDLSKNLMLLGPIPEGIQNMTHLRHLDLFESNFNSSIPDWMYSFNDGLEFLDLGENILQGVITSAIGNLTSLTELGLGNNYNLKVDDRRTIKSIGRLCNLRSLDLSGVQLNQDVANIFNDLSSCASNGLEELSLSSTRIFGNLSNVPFEKFKGLTVLSLGVNSIFGSILPSFGNLQSLMVAEFYDNLMAGAISEVQFSNLSRLRVFQAYGNQQMELKVNPSWIPPFQLKELFLPSWKLGGQFPAWLRSQKDMEILDLSNCSIVDTIPKWFSNLSMPLFYLDLSNNQLSGKVPIFSSNIFELDLSNNLFESMPKNFWSSLRGLNYLGLSKNQIAGEIPSGGVINISGGATIDLSCNNFNGQVPRFSTNLTALDLSNNSFSGSLFDFLCHRVDEPKHMGVLNLADNSLSGEIPNCWMAWNSLTALKLNNNNFIGHIPSSMGNMSQLQSLHLRNNSLAGGLLSLRSSQNLQIIDLGDNQLEGEIPTWIGKLNHLKILDLRSNKIHGKVPREICSITSLQILDLAYNNLSGHMPQCINNFRLMITGNSAITTWQNYFLRKSIQDVILVIKDKTMEYSRTLDLVRVMDLSNNFLSGNIPNTITALVGLQSLNLSHNLLMGRIPQNIGDMKKLESLDLSVNKLIGEIPLSISHLTFLSHLNLSNNNLIGRIPSSTQLQSFNASSFLGNELCGSPLSQSCDERKRSTQHKGDATDETKTGYVDVEWFCVSLVLGFVFGFWGFVFPVLYIRQWRLAYYGFLERVLCI